jgi:hypothetical protein
MKSTNVVFGIPFQIEGVVAALYFELVQLRLEYLVGVQLSYLSVERVGLKS